MEADQRKKGTGKMPVLTTIIIPYNKDRGYLKYAEASAHAQPSCDVLLAYGDASIGHNINKALATVTTPFVTIMAEDDVLPANSISNRLRAIGGANWVHGKGLLFFADGRQMDYPNSLKNPTLQQMVEANQICGGTPLYRTEFLKRHGGYDTALWTGEEYDLHLRLISRGYEPAWCNDIVYHIRVHSKQKSIGRTDREYQAVRREAIEQIKQKYR